MVAAVVGVFPWATALRWMPRGPLIQNHYRIITNNPILFFNRRYRVVPKLSTPFQGVLELAYNTTVVKYAPVKHPSGVLNFGI